jgi:hypothetical protein
MADYKVLCYHLSGETEEDHEDLVYIGGFRDIRIRGANHSAMAFSNYHYQVESYI